MTCSLRIFLKRNAAKPKYREILFIKVLLSSLYVLSDFDFNSKLKILHSAFYICFEEVLLIREQSKHHR